MASQRILSHLTPVCHVSDLPVDMENEVLWEAAFGKTALLQKGHSVTRKFSPLHGEMNKLLEGIQQKP